MRLFSCAIVAAAEFPSPVYLSATLLEERLGAVTAVKPWSA